MAAARPDVSPVLRRLFTILVGAMVLGGIAIPAAYLVLANDLPPLSTRDEVVRTLKVYVEGQRQKVVSGQVSMRVENLEKFAPVPRSELPPGIVAGALATEGCPDYFTTDKETGVTWLARVVGMAVGSGRGVPGPGQCDLKFADRLADALGLPSDVHRAIAIHRLHQALDKEDLLDFELSSRYFGPGVLGVESAARRLFGADVRSLDLADSAELLLGEGNFDQLATCRDPNKLLMWRNNIIHAMAALKLVKQPEADRAEKRPLRCNTRGKGS